MKRYKLILLGLLVLNGCNGRIDEIPGAVCYFRVTLPSSTVIVEQESDRGTVPNVGFFHLSVSPRREQSVIDLGNIKIEVMLPSWNTFDYLPPVSQSPKEYANSGEPKTIPPLDMFGALGFDIDNPPQHPWVLFKIVNDSDKVWNLTVRNPKFTFAGVGKTEISLLGVSGHFKTEELLERDLKDEAGESTAPLQDQTEIYYEFTKPLPASILSGSMQVYFHFEAEDEVMVLDETLLLERIRKDHVHRFVYD